MQVPGEPLHEYLGHFECGHLPAPDAWQVCAQLSDALSYLHEQRPRMAHRDLKLENVMFDAERRRATLIDFNLCTTATPGESGKDDECMGPAMLGTPLYLPPECRGASTIGGQAADAYGLGVVLLQLMCGRVPKPSVHDQQLLDICAREVAVRLRRLLEGHPVWKAAWFYVVAGLLETQLTGDPCRLTPRAVLGMLNECEGRPGGVRPEGVARAEYSAQSPPDVPPGPADPAPRFARFSWQAGPRPPFFVLTD